VAAICVFALLGYIAAVRILGDDTQYDLLVPMLPKLALVLVALGVTASLLVVTVAGRIERRRGAWTPSRRARRWMTLAGLAGTVVLLSAVGPSVAYADTGTGYRVGATLHLDAGTVAFDVHEEPHAAGCVTAYEVVSAEGSFRAVLDRSESRASDVPVNGALASGRKATFGVPASGDYRVEVSSTCSWSVRLYRLPLGS